MNELPIRVYEFDENLGETFLVASFENPHVAETMLFYNIKSGSMKAKNLTILNSITNQTIKFNSLPQ